MREYTVSDYVFTALGILAILFFSCLLSYKIGYQLGQLDYQNGKVEWSQEGDKIIHTEKVAKMSVCHCAKCVHFREIEEGTFICWMNTLKHAGWNHSKPAIVLNCTNYKEAKQ